MALGSTVLITLQLPDLVPGARCARLFQCARFGRDFQLLPLLDCLGVAKRLARAGRPDSDGLRVCPETSRGIAKFSEHEAD
jgi:hypothetical protein